MDKRLIAGIRMANRRLFISAQVDPSKRGMGTTIVSAVFTTNYVIVAHVGDSRLYRIRGGTIEQLTTDHTYLTQLIKDKGDLQAVRQNRLANRLSSPKGFL